MIRDAWLPPGIYFLERKRDVKNLLTIAGSDCSGGAGIQADLKTFAAHGAYGMSVITSVVAENTQRVISIRDLDPKLIRDQLDAIFEDIPVDGVKVGMLSTTTAMRVVADALERYKPPKPVIDPVMMAKDGAALMRPDALAALTAEIIPKAYVLTPNIPEAEVIAGTKIQSIDDMRKAAKAIFNVGARNVLVKGGHLPGGAEDILFNGSQFYIFKNERINTKNTHGTGCTFSSAIAANLASGMAITDAVAKAKEYITLAIRHALPIGKGHGPTNHFVCFQRNEDLL